MKDLKFTPTRDSSSHDYYQKQVLSNTSRTESKTPRGGMEDSQNHLVQRQLYESQTKKGESRLGEFELKNKTIEREKRDLLQKMHELDFEVINARVAALQKENAVLSKSKKDLEYKLQNSELKEFESRIAEYERMITILKEDRNALDKRDRASTLEFEKMKRNLNEAEFMINYLKNEKQQLEAAFTEKITALEIENQRLRADNESFSKQLEEARAALEEKCYENSQLRQEVSRIALDNISVNPSHETEKIQNALLEAQKTISVMGDEKERSEKEFRAVLDQMQSENYTLRLQIQKMSGINVEDIKKNAKESDSVLERLRHENEALQRKFEDQIANLVKEKQELENFLKDSQTEDTQHLSFESMSFPTNFFKKNNEHQEEIEKLRLRIQNLEGQNQNLIKEKQDILDKSSVYEPRQKTEEKGTSPCKNQKEDEEVELLKNLLHEKAELEKTVRELTFERDELNKALVNQLEVAAKEKEENLEQLNEVMQQLEDKGKELKKLTVELEKKHQELLTERKKAQMYESESVKELQSKLKEASEKKIELSTVVKELTGAVEKLNEDFVQQEQWIKEIEGQKQVLMDELETIKSQNEELANQKEEVELENQGLKKEISELKNHIEAFESRIASLENELEATRDSKAEAQRAFEEVLEQLKKENNKLSNELVLKSDQIEKLEEDVNRLTQELDEKSRVQESEQFGTTVVEEGEDSSEDEQSKVDDDALNASELRNENSILRMENETLKELYEKAMQESKTNRSKEKVS